MTSLGTCGWSQHMASSVETVSCRCRNYESALDLFHIEQFVYVVKLNRDVVLSDRHHGTDGTIYQASVGVNVAA